MNSNSEARQFLLNNIPGDSLNIIFHLFDRVRIDSSGYQLVNYKTENQWK